MRSLTLGRQLDSNKAEAVTNGTPHTNSIDQTVKPEYTTERDNSLTSRGAVRSEGCPDERGF
jgi:hypothetical protein